MTPEQRELACPPSRFQWYEGIRLVRELRTIYAEGEHLKVEKL